MKILFYGDTHIREYGSFPPYNKIDTNGLTFELNNMLKGFHFVADCIDKYEPDLVINLGDLYHVDNAIGIRAIYASAIGLGILRDRCRKHNIAHFLIPGNHDIYTESPEVITSVHTLTGFFNFITVDPFQYDLNGFSIYMYPYSDNISVCYSNLTYGSSADLICTHHGFMGAVNENGHVETTGLDPNTTKPVISGHIHLRQHLGDVMFPGALIQNKFNIDTSTKFGGVMVYDTDSGKYEFAINTYSKQYLRVRDLSIVSKLDPNRVVIKAITNLPKDELDEILAGFEYVHILDRSNEDDVKTVIRNISFDSPESMLKGFIAEDNPDAIEVYDLIFGENI